MRQVHKSKINQARKTKHKQGAAMGRCLMEWGVGNVYLPGLPVCFASKGQGATEKRKQNRESGQLLEKRKRTNKKIATIWNAESTGDPSHPPSKEPGTEF